MMRDGILPFAFEVGLESAHPHPEVAVPQDDVGMGHYSRASVRCLTRQSAHVARGLIRWSVLWLTLLTAACGGGGGGGGDGGGGGGGPQAQSLGGTVSGLIGSGLVLQNNGGDDLGLMKDGVFTFSKSLVSGASYDVTVKTEPSGPSQVCTVVDASGTAGAAAVSSVVVSCGSIGLLAGALGGAGYLDGTAAVSRFWSPGGIATDTQGNLYVAELNNHTIRKITPAGEVSTLAGTAPQSGSADGTGSAARFDTPAGIATDSAGNVYLVDTLNYTIRKITPGGVVSTFAGAVGQAGSADGSGGTARFAFGSPCGLATDAAANVYVADTNNNTIRKITPAGAVTTFAGAAGQAGYADGNGPAARFFHPVGVALDVAGNVYVADMGNGTIRKITAAGAVSTVAGMPGQLGYADGHGSDARFSQPIGIATDATGNMYVTDSSIVRKITAAGDVSTFAGGQQPGYADGAGSAASFNDPRLLATDAAGNVYVADAGNSTIRKITPAGGVGTLAGAAPVPVGSADGKANTARFNRAQGIAADSTGNVYVADTNNHTIRKITSDGQVGTLAGTAGEPGSADGNGTAARFYNPAGVVTDLAGNVYVADTGNFIIRKITPSGDVSTFAGAAGQAGSADGSGGTARFAVPTALTIDSAGDIYVGDVGNFSVRKITPGGVVSTLAGGQIGTEDGLGPAARFITVAGIATDSAGNVYVADNGSSTIRKITPAGDVTTIAGQARQTGFADGSGTDARFYGPSGLATDAAGNLYVTDTGNNTIRMITPGGTVMTVVGTPATRGDEVGPLPGSLDFPQALAALPGPTVALVETDFENVVLEILP